MRNYLKTGIIALAFLLVTTLGSSATSVSNEQPDRPFVIDIAKTHNLPSTKTNNVSSTTQFMNLESIIDKHTVKLDLDEIRKQNAPSNQISVCLKRAEDAKQFGEYTLSLRPMLGTIENRSTTTTTQQQKAAEGELTFRYLPERFFIEITKKDGGIKTTIDKTNTIQQTILKTVITDRDRKEEYQGKLQQRQKTFLIEGDKFNPFGYIIAWSLVSTGKANMDNHPGNYTPLGYYYIKSKDENAYNDREGRKWAMPYALWYTKKSGTPEGINGLHAYEKTQFGIEASHGCTREPKEFAKEAFAWCDIGTPLIIIGNQQKHHQDKNRFNETDYQTYQTILTELLDFRHQIEENQYEQTTLTKEQIDILAARTPLLEAMRQQPFSAKEKYLQRPIAQMKPLIPQTPSDPQRKEYP